MNGYLLSRDAGWHADKALMADLSQLNTAVTRYVLRHLDVDAGRAHPISIEDERALGLKLMELGDRLQRRAALRQSQVGGPVIEGEAAQPPALEPGRRPDMNLGP